MADSVDRVATVSRMVVLAEVLTPVRNLAVNDLDPLASGGAPLAPFADYETAQVRVLSVLAQQAGAEVFGVTAGSVQDVGWSTALRTPRTDDGVTTPECDRVPPGSTLPGVGTQVALFLGQPGPMPDGTPDLHVIAALHPTASSPDLLAPSATPLIAGVGGPLRGQQAPVGWLAAVPALIGSGIGALPRPAA